MTYEIIEKTIKGKCVENLNLKFVKWSDGKVFCMIKMNDGNWYWYNYIWICEKPKKVSEFESRYYYKSIDDFIKSIGSKKADKLDISISELESYIGFYKFVHDPEIMDNIVNPIVYRY